MTHHLLLTAARTAVMAFDAFRDSVDTTGCEPPLAVCDGGALTFATHSVNALYEAYQLDMQRGTPVDTVPRALVAKLAGYFRHVTDTADGSGCDAPYVVIELTVWDDIQQERDALALAVAPLDPTQVLREALERSRVAIDDWLNIHAPEFCDEARVAEARERIHAHGATLAYITDVQQQTRAALGHDPR